jgi:hypothetical protein
MAEYKKDKENEIADGQSHFLFTIYDLRFTNLRFDDLTMYDLRFIYDLFIWQFIFSGASK